MSAHPFGRPVGADGARQLASGSLGEAVYPAHRLIDGRLCWRGGPDEHWTALSEADANEFLEAADEVLVMDHPAGPLELAARAEDARSRAGGVILDVPTRICRECGCSELDACIDADGSACHWVEWDLCSACDQRNRVQRFSRLHEGATQADHLERILLVTGTGLALAFVGLVALSWIGGVPLP